MNVCLSVFISALLCLSVTFESWAQTNNHSNQSSQTGQSGGGGKKIEIEPLSDPNEVFFSVLKFDVEGNTLLTQERIDEVLREYRGFAQTIDDLEHARIALEKTYHEEGYPFVLVVLPEQSVASGTINLSVVESKLGNVTITGNKHFSQTNIRRKMPSVKSGWIVYEPTFKKELAVANFHPDLHVTPVPRPGKEQGLVDLELKVNDRLPLHAKLTGNNKGTLSTPRNRIVAELQYTNLFDRDHHITLQSVQTPEDWGAVQVYGATYVAPLTRRDHLLVAFASYSKSSSILAGTGLATGEASVGTIGIAGNSEAAGVRYTFPFWENDTVTNQFSIGWDYTRLEASTASFPAGLGTAVVRTPIQYAPVSLGYTGILPHHRGITQGNLTLKGYIAGMIPGGDKVNFGGDPNDPYNNPGNRTGSTGTFGVVKTSLDRTQVLPENFTLLAHVDGQWANEPLIVSEQIYAGGLDTVRGYIQNETLGDIGVRTRLEAQTPSQFFHFDRPYAPRVKADVKIAVFYDTAFLWVLRPTPGQTPKFQLEGAGLGLRLGLSEIIQLQLDQAWAMRDGSVSKRGDTFTHFLVTLTL